MKPDPGFPEMIATDDDQNLVYRHGTLHGYCVALRKILDEAPSREAVEQDLAETEANKEAIIAEFQARHLRQPLEV